MLGDVYLSDKTNTKVNMKLVPHLIFAILLTTELAFSQEKTEAQPGGSKSEGAVKESPRDPSTEPKLFTFGGGTLRDFISSFKKQLGMDLYDEASIDPKALSMQVPKMRIPLGGLSWDVVLNTYNILSHNTEQSLGRWVIVRAVGSGNDPTPNAIIFTPPKSLVEEPSVKVKAFSMEKLQEDQQIILRDLVNGQAEHLRQRSEIPGNYSGQIHYHSGTGLIIASGGPAFVEIAATIIEAYREAVANRRIGNPE
jgi:hypothetical protein